MYITTQNAFEDFIERASHSSVLAIDTEFLREKTYHARLCLLQLATEEEQVIVDPFKVTDLSPLRRIFETDSIVKLFHAGRQDVEILYNSVGVMPWPVFDTQIAAAVLGYTQQIGYGPLVSAECGVQLKKIDSFTDWSRRPLTESQIEYAADDVIYLPKLHDSMMAQLKAQDRVAWLDEDFRNLVDPARYEMEPRERYKRLKRVSQLSRKQLSAAREVAAWREEKASERDIPRKWVLSDEQVIEACKRETRTLDQLFMVRGVKEKLSVADARTIVSLIAAGIDAPKESWPHYAKKTRNESNVDIPVDLMSAIVRLRARQNGIAFQTLASHDDLTDLARGHYEDVELLKGWRREIVGDELRNLLEGKLALRLHDRSLVIDERRDSGPEPLGLSED